MTNVATLLTDTVAAHPDRLTIRLSDDVLTCAERDEASAAPSACNSRTLRSGRAR